MSTPASRLSSPRVQRQLLWVGGIVLAVAIAVVIATVVWTGPKETPVTATPGPVVKPTKERTVPLDPAAKRVGERFIETAVERKNLAESWRLVDPALRSDFTLRRWKTGNIPVVPYPADTSRGAPVKVEYSYKDEVLLLVLLQPKAGDTTKPQLFHLGLHAYGTGKNRHWLVNYWGPFGAPKIPNG